MEKTVLAIGLLVSFSSYGEQISDKVVEYCGNTFSEYSHTIEIGEVQGVASHRDGYWQINQGSHDKALKWELLKMSELITDPSDCLTYISNLGIASFDNDKGQLVARVNFAFDRYYLTPLARGVLADVAKHLADSNYLVTVEGHADWVGSEEYNQALGMNRAESTADQLFTYGVRKENMTLKSFGESEPIASNKTSQGRAKNRRSDVYIPPESFKQEMDKKAEEAVVTEE
ncbi:outer membrane lipoprotein precursor OmpA family [Vibrio astriarenae]|nr:outer membrane lipoprotein precursor OmpA family [Vibrio sp. C7]